MFADHILAYQMRPINTFFYLMCYIPDNEFICAYIEMLFGLHCMIGATTTEKKYITFCIKSV